MDVSIDTAARRFREFFSIDDYALRGGFYQLTAALRNYKEPDYHSTAITLAYALEYMPRRVTSIVGALRLAPRPIEPIRRVLDIGSGTGATSLAIQLIIASGSSLFDQKVVVVGLDPSPAMHDFARRLDLPSVTHAAKIGGWESLEHVTQKGYFDLAVMSACLPYGCDDPESVGFFGDHVWNAAATALRDSLTAWPLMVAIQPFVKNDILSLSTRRLAGTVLRTSGYSTRRFPVLLRTSRPLPVLARSFSSLAPDWTPVTWNASRSEQVRFLFP